MSENTRACGSRRPAARPPRHDVTVRAATASWPPPGTAPPSRLPPPGDRCRHGQAPRCAADHWPGPDRTASVPPPGTGPLEAAHARARGQAARGPARTTPITTGSRTAAASSRDLHRRPRAGQATPPGALYRRAAPAGRLPHREPGRGTTRQRHAERRELSRRNRHRAGAPAHESYSEPAKMLCWTRQQLPQEARTTH